MTSRKPLVAVTGPNSRFRISWWAIRFNLFLVGLRAIYIYPNGPKLDQTIDGLIISGGDDIHPVHYGDEEQVHSRYDIARDELEITILSRYLESDIPILGICRGSQLLNIVSKGSLYADIRPHRKETPNRYTALPVKRVNLIADSQLRAHVAETIAVNSLHNQAVKEVGHRLTVTGRDADGFVQSIERTDRFVVGVQWHPEYLPYMADHRGIFRCFANAVKQGISPHSS